MWGRRRFFYSDASKLLSTRHRSARRSSSRESPNPAGIKDHFFPDRHEEKLSKPAHPCIFRPIPPRFFTAFRFFSPLRHISPPILTHLTTMPSYPPAASTLLRHFCRTSPLLLKKIRILPQRTGQLPRSPSILFATRRGRTSVSSHCFACPSCFKKEKGKKLRAHTPGKSLPLRQRSCDLVA